MIQIEVDFDDSLWAKEQKKLSGGECISAVRFLTLLEGETDDFVEEAFADLECRNIRLDISPLPKTVGTGETAIRLRQEENLVKSGNLFQGLEESDPLRLYLEEIAGIPACGDVDLLAAQLLGGDESVRQKLVELSLSRVVAIAGEHTGYGVMLLDLIQEGSMGLWQSILSYESGDFEAHRDFYIRQSMAKVITLQARANGVGQKMRQALEDYRSVDERLLAELGRNPTISEIAEQIHMSLEETALVADMLENVRNMNRAKQPVEHKEAEPDDEQAVEDTAYFQMRQRIEELLSGLDERSARLLTLRFGLEGGLPVSPDEAGKELNMTAQEVVAAEAAALAKLRDNR